MRKYILALASLSIFLVTELASFGDNFASSEKVEKMRLASVGICVYYYMSEEEYVKRIVLRQKQFRGHFGPYPLVIVATLEEAQLIIPVSPKLTVKGPPGMVVKTLAYIGSGTIVKDNHVITVDHLVGQEEGTYGQQVFLFVWRWDHAPEADVIAVSGHESFADDYAVVRSREPLLNPGVKIAKAGKLKIGDRVIAIGSPGGIPWTIRFNYISQNRWLMRRGGGEDQGIQLIQFDIFPYWTFYEGTYGDSGGGLFTEGGELASINYCGIDLYGIELLFSNPTSMLWDFLKKNKLEDLGK